MNYIKSKYTISQYLNINCTNYNIHMPYFIFNSYQAGGFSLAEFLLLLRANWFVGKRTAYFILQVVSSVTHTELEDKPASTTPVSHVCHE